MFASYVDVCTCPYGDYLEWGSGIWCMCSNPGRLDWADSHFELQVTYTVQYVTVKNYIQELNEEAIYKTKNNIEILVNL